MNINTNVQVNPYSYHCRMTNLDFKPTKRATRRRESMNFMKIWKEKAGPRIKVLNIVDTKATH